ncbi:hypothetical protein JCM8547_006244 [Rhodosporidiobolus lusitaniae]
MSANALEKKDCLTSLPKELLQLICRLVQQQWRAPYLGLVCKAFLPFARSKRFSKISIRHPSRLKQLIEIFKARPEAGASVKELELDFFPWAQENESVFPSRQDFLAFLSTLTKLESLTIKRATTLIRALLSNTSISPLLPSLIRIILEDPFTGWANPFDPSHFYHLRRHTELRCFTLLLDRSLDSQGPYTRPATFPQFDSTWSRFVDLKGPLTRTPSNANDLADTLLGVFPPGLRCLGLDLPFRPESFTWLSCMIRKFRNLEALDFGSNMGDGSVIRLMHRDLPNLEDVFFQGYCGLDDVQDVKDLLEGQTAFRTSASCTSTIC